MLLQKHCTNLRRPSSGLAPTVCFRPGRPSLPLAHQQDLQLAGSNLLSKSKLDPGSWSEAAKPRVATSATGPNGGAADAPRVLRVNYVRKDQNYKGWGLHVWGDTPDCTQWQQPRPPTRTTPGGLQWDLRLPPGGGGGRVGMLVHKGEQQAARAEVSVPGGSGGGGGEADGVVVASEVWLAAAEHRAYPSPPDLSSIPAGSVNKQGGHWVAPGLLLWRQAAEDGAGPRTFTLHGHSKGYMWINGAGVQGPEESWELSVVPGAVPSAQVTRFPHLYGCTVLAVPPAAQAKLGELLTGQLLVSVKDARGEALDATGVQVQGVLDQSMVYDGPLGAHPDPAVGGHAITLWAPTATRVELLYYGPNARGGTAQVHPMLRGPSGTWSLPRPPAWLWHYYTYRVSVWCPWTARFETVEVTDPYSRGLAADGTRTQIVDLDHPDTMPEGWADHAMPPMAQWTDISVYELHVRDFSVTDPSVPAPLRGKFLAFCPDRVRQHGGGTGSAGGAPTHGLAHLASLKAAGLTHLHLLPIYDFATVPEREGEQRRVEEDLSRHPPDSPHQQSAVAAVADQDGFNWGYDPVHWGVPEGSYATDPDGVARIRELREAVAALHGQGWRVVPDVVYNHVFAAGPASRHSVLDKIVPGYYQRRHEDGAIADSTCCNNTAPEHAMCERLIVDDITHWARTYKVDGFRFDIMGHLMVATMTRIRRGLDALTPEKDGVHGKGLYLYGEAWDFGEVAGNQRGRNAGQMNLAGSGLGAFNDRMRDGALGGGPFAPPQFQGLITGLSLAPNPRAAEQGGPAEQAAELAVLTDWVRSTLAGNLRTYPLTLCDGTTRPGEQALCHGLPLAYGGLPHENVAFIGCHDNKTLFDQIVEKAHPEEPAEERMRMALLGLALIALSQGVPFFHAGDELLRSKSLDRDSYNSGDWFNRIDWTGASHGFGSGLPPASKNGGSWDYMRPLLAAAERIRPSPEHMRTANEAFQALLRVRYSSPLFRLDAPGDVVRQLAFHNTGPGQVPGVIVMELTSTDGVGSGTGGGVHDPAHERLIAVVNCAPTEAAVPFPPGVPQGTSLELHTALAAVADPRLAAAAAHGPSRTLRVPPRTPAVFVQRR